MPDLKIDISDSMTPLIDEAVRKATENVSYRVEKHAEKAVVEILRSRGYIVIEPVPSGGIS